MRTALLLTFTLLAALTLGCARKPPPAPPEPSAQEYFDSGLRAYKMENYAQAAQNFEMAASKSPSMQEALYYLGLSCWRMNLTANARKSFVEVLNLNPGHLYARESLGILLYRDGNVAEAQRQLEAARGLGSINPDVYLALGRVYAAQARCPDAAEALQRGLAVDSSNASLRAELANVKKTCGRAPKGKPKAPATRAPEPRAKKAAKAAPAPAAPASSLTGGAAPLTPGQF
ncbi:tetratricopeptide repeat protein [Fundidesulfovibrio soli]|uniref:tetratricopeptide repeat protein n=1 Tax=Fundidesulfovibrio soli TaxID=2922716 RepID=UPI001FAEBF09|nr:tetratricopeptide repeat protein [Fundidesulfovibrio soli]